MVTSALNESADEEGGIIFILSKDDDVVRPTDERSSGIDTVRLLKRGRGPLTQDCGERRGACRGKKHRLFLKIVVLVHASSPCSVYQIDVTTRKPNHYSA